MSDKETYDGVLQEEFGIGYDDLLTDTLACVLRNVGSKTLEELRDLCLYSRAREYLYDDVANCFAEQWHEDLAVDEAMREIMDEATEIASKRLKQEEVTQ